MPRNKQTAEFNTFVGGLVTEAGPLTFPENASLDEDNFVLQKDGSRRRRLGMDTEYLFSRHTTAATYDESKGLVTSTAKWKNAGGDGQKVFLVVQVGFDLIFYDTATSPISANVTLSTTLSIPSGELKRFSYAVVDGKLVVATGARDISVFSYSTAGGITQEVINLKVRDSFGVSDVISSEDLLEGQGLSKRPTSTTAAHNYNLRNQTWAVPRPRYHDGGHFPPPEDTISIWKRHTPHSWPSNSDATTYGLFSLAVADDPAQLRLNIVALQNNPPGTFRAPSGYFIIDFLRRGTSRKSEVNKLHATYPQLVHGVGALPVDETPGGASVVAEFSGRVWYGGFSGEVNGGDDRSPNLSSYVAYSQLVQGVGYINRCYQDGDPTSEKAPDLLDTDGGFVKLDGAYNIQQMVSLGDGLFVLAENGVWRVSGGSDAGFTANSHIVTKVTEHGTTAPNSIAVVDGGLMYWGDDGIYLLAPNEFGDWGSSTISDKISTLYRGFSSEEKADVFGIYDSYDKKVRWLYSERGFSGSSPRELVFDVDLKAFYQTTIGNLLLGLPRPIMPVEVPPFTTGEEDTLVESGGSQVQHLGDAVTVSSTFKKSVTREVFYVTILTTNPTIEITFSSYRDQDFLDWETYSNSGVDAPAYLLTGYIGNGDYQRNKQIPYVFFHFRRTETGLYSPPPPDDPRDPTPALELKTPSSCLVKAQWDWSNSANSGRWGREFQAYRYRRKYVGVDVNDPFDTGFSTVVTKNKLRGKGRVVSLLLSTEEGKDLDLLGWSLTLGTNADV